MDSEWRGTGVPIFDVGDTQSRMETVEVVRSPIKELKLKFNGYVSIGSTIFDTTPDAATDSGEIEIPTVCLDGDFTIEDLEEILILFRESDD